MKKFTLIALALLAPLCAVAQEMKEGFEEWTDQGGGRNDPMGWSSYGFGAGMVDSAVYAGNYAASTCSWYGGVIGYLITGEEPFSMSEFDRAGIPIDFVPTILTGYYKYDVRDSRKGDDSAGVYVMLKRYDTERRDIDTLAYVIRLLPPSGEWIPFSIELPLRIKGTQPDSVVIAFYSHNPDLTTQCLAGTCCYLSIDELSLTSTSGVRYDVDRLLRQARVVPNPVRRSARIEFDGEEGESYRIRLFDAGGREVYASEFKGSQIELSDHPLSAGVYYFSITNADGLPRASGEFVVDR